MQNFRVVLVFLIACSFLSSDTFAFSRRAPKVIDYPQTAYIEGNSNSSLPATSYSPSDDMVKLAQSASQGAGNLKEKGALCYRAVKQIIADALGKDLACVRSILSSGSAKDAGADLLRMGFIEDSSQCKTPGAIRVYKGSKPYGKYRPTAGDIHGHIEVIGDDGEYHSFYRSSLPMNESVDPPGRRALTGCYVPHYDKIRNAPLNKCPDSKVSYKSGTGSGQKKKGGYR
ncbi:hypothetical protein [Bdellovibrio bacteriovorus]|uniref:hypothetical protein n=1 Tax=Bdellovibrio TaxID=958 RepID=UPI0035A99268